MEEEEAISPNVLALDLVIRSPLLLPGVLLSTACSPGHGRWPDFVRLRFCASLVLLGMEKRLVKVGLASPRGMLSEAFRTDILVYSPSTKNRLGSYQGCVFCSE